jgi:hypothetical protein
MPTIDLPIANGFYLSESLPISAQECNNWYPNLVQTQGLSQETLIGTPGLKQIVNTGEIEQTNRGFHVKSGIPYIVNGNSLYSLDRVIGESGVEEFSYTLLGSIDGTDRVFMSDNGTQLLILVPGIAGYIYNEDDGTPFQEILDPDFTANGNPEGLEFLDGYFILTTDEKKFIISALNDGLSYNALDFGTAEADPDEIVAPVVYKNQLFIMGSETTETFQNQGGAGFPFVRINGYVFDKGLFARYSIAKSNNTFYMIGGGVNESAAVWQFAGNGFVKVSTTAIDYLINSFTDVEIANAFSWSYAQNGAYFIGFSIGDRTIVYEAITKRWHERSSVINELQNRYRVNSLVVGYGRVLCGDSQEGIIGELDIDTYTEYDNRIQRIASTPNFTEQLKSVRVPEIELTLESGSGNELESNPKVGMDYSDDGGKTFEYERLRSTGKIGEYNKRAIWRKNGRFPRFRILRFKLSDPVKPSVIKLTARIV